MKRTLAILAALVISFFSYSQSEVTCGRPAIKFYNLPDELYAGEESGFIARLLSYGYVDTLCSVVYTIYKDEEPVVNISDVGRASFRVRVKQEEYTDVTLTEGTGRLGFRYQLTSFMGFDVYAATLGIFDGYCPGVYNPNDPLGGRRRPFNFSFVMDEYGMYRINFTIYKCNNANININSIYSSFPSYPDALGCCDSNTHSDKASGVCTDPEMLYESDLFINVVSTKILAQPQGRTMCAGETTTLSVSAQTMLDNGLTYQWYRNDTAIENANSATYVASEAGTYYCMIDDGREPRRSDDAVVVVPQFEPLPTFYICANETATVDVPGYVSYSWFNESSSSSVQVSEAGEYQVSVVDSHGCALSGSVVVESAPAYNPLIVDTVRFCDGESIMVELDSAVVTSAHWSGVAEAIGETCEISAAGMCYVESVAYTCAYSDSVFAEIYDRYPYNPIAFDTLLLCTGAVDTILFDADIVSSAVWNDNPEENELVYPISQAGTYYVDVSAYGCTYNDSVVVYTPVYELIALDSISFCAGDSAVAEILVSNAIGIEVDDTAVSIVVSDDSESTYVEFEQAGIYHITAEVEGCIQIDSVVVIEKPLPVSGLHGMYEFTSGTSDTIIELSANEGYDSYLWNDGTEQSTLVVNCAEEFSNDVVEKTYVLTMLHAGCQASDTIVVRFVVVTDVNNVNESSWTISPNPSDGHFVIEGPDFDRADLYDMRGLLLREVYDRNVDISALPSGSYMLTISAGDDTVKVKIMITR